MLLAILSLSSCGERKDGALTVFYCVSLSDDMAQMADMAITYKLADGTCATDTITGTSWEKTVVLDSFPAIIGMVDYTFIPKPESGLKKEEYDPMVVFSMFARETEYNLETELVNFYRVKRDKVANFIDIANDNGQSSITKIATKEGSNFTITDNDPENEKIRLITENPLKKMLPDKETPNDTTIDNN